MSKSYNFCPSTSATRSSSGCVAFINILLIRLFLMFCSLRGGHERLATLPPG